jgi:nucleoside-diphosphate-sugar epimerase
VRAFVTGGTGFLGRRIVRRLIDQGYDVSVLARDESRGETVKKMGAKVVIGDLGDIEGFVDALAGCDLVVLAGARAVPGGTWEEFFEQNVAATERLIDSASEAGARRIVYVSSLGIFDIPKDGVTITEDTDYDHHPLVRGNYTRSKIDADRVVRAAIREGKPVVMVRPGQIYGHDHPLGQPLYLGRVSKRVGDNLLVVIGNKSYLTPITYVENAADAVVAAGMVEDPGNRVFNIVDDPDLTHRRYFEAVGKLPGYPSKQLFVPVALFVPALIVVNFLHKLLKRRPFSVAYQLRRAGYNARYSTDAAREVLGWAPRVELEEALRATATGGM